MWVLLRSIDPFILRWRNWRNRSKNPSNLPSSTKSRPKLQSDQELTSSKFDSDSKRRTCREIRGLSTSNQRAVQNPLEERKRSSRQWTSQDCLEKLDRL